jgi:single-stranded DNA-binding protein
MITLTGHGRLTRDVNLRTTHSGKTVATISVASDRRDRDAQPVYVDLIVWQAQATAAAQHLVKGQAVSFSGRFEPREYTHQRRREPDRARAARRRHRVRAQAPRRPVHRAAAGGDPRGRPGRHPVLTLGTGRAAGQAARSASRHEYPSRAPSPRARALPSY